MWDAFHDNSMGNFVIKGTLVYLIIFIETFFALFSEAGSTRPWICFFIGLGELSSPSTPLGASIDDLPSRSYD